MVLFPVPRFTDEAECTEPGSQGQGSRNTHLDNGVPPTGLTTK